MTQEVFQVINRANFSKGYATNNSPRVLTINLCLTVEQIVVVVMSCFVFDERSDSAQRLQST